MLAGSARAKSALTGVGGLFEACWHVEKRTRLYKILTLELPSK